MAFKSVENDSGLLPEGEYEVYVKDCRYDTTRSGLECIKFDFVIRQDVEQSCRGRHKFKQFYPDQSGAWPAEKLGKYANALGIPKGEDFELEDLIGRSCRMVTRQYTDERTGELRDCIFYLKPGQAKPLVSPPPGAGPAVDVNAGDWEDTEDGDLPF